jgi:glyoxylase-like metal-dependent hydrolase (beta-lactamase superfamily II)
MTEQNAARYRVGAVDLAIVSDGTFYQDAGVVMGVVPRSVWEPVIGPPLEHNLVALALNSLLVRSAGKTILVDTGIGTKLTPVQRERHFPGDYGHLLEDLRRLGIGPEDIDAVVNTHLHFDHCGWNTASVHGQALPTFPNATYYVQRAEFEAATHANERTRGSYLVDNYVPLQQAGQLELVDGERAVTDEVHIVPTPGHTEDHCSVVVASGGDTAIFIGDIVQHAVQLERTAWIAAFDVLPLISIETKKALLERAYAQQSLVVSVHAPFPGAGRFADVEGRRRFISAEPLADAPGWPHAARRSTT